MSEKNEERKYPEPVVGALVVNKEGKILLAKSKRWSGKYIIPGGHVLLGESLTEALKKKVKSETGLDINVIAKLNFRDDLSPKEFFEKRHFIYHNFLCEFKDDPKKIKLSGEFEKGYAWLDPEGALKLDLLDSIRELINTYLKYRESQNYLDSWKRCQADFENYKKSQVAHQEEFLKYAKMDVISQIFPVLDNFEISLAHVPEDKKENGWVEGITHIKRQIEDVLKNNDIEEIVVKVGDEFNPKIHEAVAGKGEKVKKVLQKGYKLNGRIIRAAKVEVG